MPCKKVKCLKQVNLKFPDVYFGTPFEYDPNWMGCYLCQYDNPETKSKPKLIKRVVSIQESMQKIKGEEWQKNPSVRTGGAPFRHQLNPNL